MLDVSRNTYRSRYSIFLGAINRPAVEIAVFLTDQPPTKKSPRLGGFLHSEVSGWVALGSWMPAPIRGSGPEHRQPD